MYLMIQNILLSLCVYVWKYETKQNTKMLTEVILGVEIMRSFHFFILLKFSIFAMMNMDHYSCYGHKEKQANGGSYQRWPETTAEDQMDLAFFPSCFLPLRTHPHPLNQSAAG